MKLSTIGFYYDFTRFFAKHHGQITPSGQRVDVTNYAAHASGYLFENVPGQRRVFLPFATRLSPSQASLETAALDDMGQYLTISGLSERRARRISRKYAAYFLKEFRKNRPDVVIISGDTRTQSRAAAHACRELGLRHFYFEQGPFGTTIMDPEGVNCLASFAKTFAVPPASEDQVIATQPSPAQAKTPERKVVRTLDYLVQPLLLALGFQEIKEEKAFFKQVSRQIWALRKSRSAPQPAAQTPDPAPAGKPFVLVVGQVPTDANFSLNSPYTTSLELVRDVEEMFPGVDILFREHPLFIGSYGADFYAHFEQSPRLSFSRGTRLDTEIDTADHIVVVNSTVGMEVVLKHQKPILCLGDASYLHLNGVHSRADLDAYTSVAPRIPDEDHLANWTWFQNSFVQGHFRDQDLQPLISNILEKIHEV